MSGFRAVRMTLADVRSWHRQSLEFADGLTLISGPNGAGKTTLIEAIAFGCLGVSPRTAREGELVRHGAGALHIDLDLMTPTGLQHRGIGYAPGRGRRLQLDGAPVSRLSSWRARALLVFLPEELRAVKGPPAARRRALDRVLEAAVPGYAGVLADYHRALSQRNALLRRVRAGEAGDDGLAVWERALASRGATIARERAAGAEALAAPFARWLEALGGGPGGALHLEPSLDPVTTGIAEDALAQAIAERLANARPRDIAAAQTLTGPHRDDLWIGAQHGDLRRVGSQGEQRTAALALLLAAREHLARSGPRPILLLDDVLSELDPNRRARLLSAVGTEGQTIITSADPLAMGSDGAAAEVIRVKGGSVVE